MKSIAVWLTLLAATATASAGEEASTSRVGFLGPSRAIAHAYSASRDTPAMQWQLAPRVIRMGGGEFSLVQIGTRAGTVRVGFLGFLELEAEDEPAHYYPGPGGTDFWRGHYGLFAGMSAPRLAARLCRGCELEGVVAVHHESEHVTGSSDGSATGTSYADVPIIGDYALPEVAVRVPRGRFAVTARLQDRIFIPGRSEYRNGPGADLIVEWSVRPRLQLFSSTFAEYLFAGDVPDAYLVRNMTGVVLPSDLGRVFVYLSADVGHRKGIAVFTEERTAGFGVRVAY